MTLGRCPVSIFCSRGTLPYHQLVTRENRQSKVSLIRTHCERYHRLQKIICKGEMLFQASILSYFWSHSGPAQARHEVGASYPGANVAVFKTPHVRWGFLHSRSPSPHLRINKLMTPGTNRFRNVAVFKPPHVRWRFLHSHLTECINQMILESQTPTKLLSYCLLLRIKTIS